MRTILRTPRALARRLRALAQPEPAPAAPRPETVIPDEARRGSGLPTLVDLVAAAEYDRSAAIVPQIRAHLDAAMPKQTVDR